MVNMMEQDFVDIDKDETEYVAQMMKWITRDDASIPNSNQIKAKMEHNPSTEIFSPFQNQEFTWKFVEPGTPVMSEVGFPASIYKIPPPMYQHIVQSTHKDSSFFHRLPVPIFELLPQAVLGPDVIFSRAHPRWTPACGVDVFRAQRSSY
jgi:hypothetical protein